MDIHYQDKNLIVTYLQIFLRENVGMTVHRVVPRDRRYPAYYEITTNETIKVTGDYNEQTYTALALYMAYNYPNEGFPKKWTVSPVTNKWYSEDYYYTGNQDELIDVISNNISNYSQDSRLIEVPERVLAYIFGEVATPESSPEEILRVKQKIYSEIYADDTHREPLQYHQKMFDEIICRQLEILEKYQSGLSTTETTLVGQYLVKYDRKTNTKEETSELKNDFKVRRTAIETSVVLKTSGSSSDILSKFNMEYGSDDSVIKSHEESRIISIKLIYTDSKGKLTEMTSDKVSYHQGLESYYEISFDTLPNLSSVETIVVNYELPYESYSVVSGLIVFKEPLQKGQEVVVVQTVLESEPPEQLKGFKVTGYFDPWTERFMKEGTVRDV